VSVKKYAKMFGACSLEYYCAAVQQISPQLPLVIVTDDRAWVNEFLRDRFPDRSVFVGSGKDHLQDIAILAGADEVALSNSTFSWWGAFLGSASTVIYPSPWFSDPTRDQNLPLSSWISLPRDP